MTLPTTPEELLAYANKVISVQTFSTLIGARFTSISPTCAELRVPLREDLRQHHGFAHGGLLATMADIGLTFMGAMVLGPNVLTSEYKINFLRPGTGHELIARSSVISSSKRQAVTRCDIFAVSDSGEEKLIATALGTIVKSEAAPVKGAELLSGEQENPL